MGVRHCRFSMISYGYTSIAIQTRFRETALGISEPMKSISMMDLTPVACLKLSPSTNRLRSDHRVPLFVAKFAYNLRDGRCYESQVYRLFYLVASTLLDCSDCGIRCPLLRESRALRDDTYSSY